MCQFLNEIMNFFKSVSCVESEKDELSCYDNDDIRILVWYPKMKGSWKHKAISHPKELIFLFSSSFG